MSYSLPIPDITIHRRRGGDWQRTSLQDEFGPGAPELLVTLPGAWISDRQVLWYDRVYCGYQTVHAVVCNDSFVCNEWAAHLDLQRINIIPDGNGEICRALGVQANTLYGMRCIRTEWEVWGSSLKLLEGLKCK